MIFSNRYGLVAAMSVARVVFKNVPVDSGIVTISRSLSISTAADLICIRFGLPMGKSDEPEMLFASVPLPATNSLLPMTAMD